MRPPATGRPGTEVIPTGWATGHGTAADGSKTATVTLRQPGTTTSWDEANQRTVSTPLAPYATDVPARIQALTNDARTVDAAEQQVTVAGYLVAVPLALDPAVGDLIQVTSSGDPTLDGRDLTVVDVVRGSLRLERDLFCTLSS
ncbi:DUF6093 family protein [Nocardioides pakistanensis]